MSRWPGSAIAWALLAAAEVVREGRLAEGEGGGSAALLAASALAFILAYIAESGGRPALRAPRLRR
jgi:hypothetical protein